MNNYNPDTQRLYFDNLINCRDLGQMPLSSGNLFVSHKILRSGSPSLATQKAHDLLVEYGVNCVIDLRSETEFKNYGNPFADDGVTNFYNISLFVGDPDTDEDPTMVFLRTHPLGDFYVIMLNELGKNIVEVLRKIIANKDGVTLFHCAHGKDRTGVIAAILYLIAGASREDIVLNYKVSYEYAKDFLGPLVEAREEEMKHTLKSDAINMEIFLDYVQSKYNGDITIFLKENGMTDSEINELKALCLG
ncbi:MAG: tyrosine-protein phosphatase [Saccharofermentans sp.]|nr:tyrosine-protein phosphatase [Saccharofermentans sp.]